MSPHSYQNGVGKVPDLKRLRFGSYKLGMVGVEDGLPFGTRMRQRVPPAAPLPSLCHVTEARRERGRT